MTLQTRVFFALLVAWCVCATADDAERRAGVDFMKQTTLGDAVKQFNAQVNRTSDLGREQPPLTVDELVAAIRAWDTEKNPIVPELHAVFHSIAETGKLPSGSHLDYSTGWDPGRGYQFTVWRVNLSISAPHPTKADSRIGYTFRVRDRIISSRQSEEPIANPDLDKMTDRDRQRYIAKHILGMTKDSGN